MVQVNHSFDTANGSSDSYTTITGPVPPIVDDHQVLRSPRTRDYNTTTTSEDWTHYTVADRYKNVRTSSIPGHKPMLMHHTPSAEKWKQLQPAQYEQPASQQEPHTTYTEIHCYTEQRSHPEGANAAPLGDCDLQRNGGGATAQSLLQSPTAGRITPAATTPYSTAMVQRCPRAAANHVTYRAAPSTPHPQYYHGDMVQQNGNNHCIPRHHQEYGYQQYTAPQHVTAAAISYPHGDTSLISLTDKTLMVLKAPELNRILRINNISREQQKMIKNRRRLLLNRGYARNCRSRNIGKIQQLEENLHLLQQQVCDCRAAFVEQSIEIGQYKEELSHMVNVLRRADIQYNPLHSRLIRKLEGTKDETPNAIKMEFSSASNI